MLYAFNLVSRVYPQSALDHVSPCRSPWPRVSSEDPQPFPCTVCFILWWEHIGPDPCPGANGTMRTTIPWPCSLLFLGAGPQG